VGTLGVIAAAGELTVGEIAVIGVVAPAMFDSLAAVIGGWLTAAVALAPPLSP
jgi:hypothetical protein